MNEFHGISISILGSTAVRGPKERTQQGNSPARASPPGRPRRPSRASPTRHLASKMRWDSARARLVHSTWNKFWKAFNNSLKVCNNKNTQKCLSGSSVKISKALRLVVSSCLTCCVVFCRFSKRERMGKKNDCHGT